jgi:hypothetical protein
LTECDPAGYTAHSRASNLVAFEEKKIDVKTRSLVVTRWAGPSSEGHWRPALLLIMILYRTYPGMQCRIRNWFDFLKSLEVLATTKDEDTVITRSK